MENILEEVMEEIIEKNTGKFNKTSS